MIASKRQDCTSRVREKVREGRKRAGQKKAKKGGPFARHFIMI